MHPLRFPSSTAEVHICSEQHTIHSHTHTTATTHLFLSVHQLDVVCGRGIGGDERKRALLPRRLPLRVQTLPFLPAIIPLPGHSPASHVLALSSEAAVHHPCVRTLLLPPHAGMLSLLLPLQRLPQAHTLQVLQIKLERATAYARVSLTCMYRSVCRFLPAKLSHAERIQNDHWRNSNSTCM